MRFPEVLVYCLDAVMDMAKRLRNCGVEEVDDWSPRYGVC